MRIVDVTETGKNIKRMMNEAGITITELSNMILVSYVSIRFWRNGRSLPSSDNLANLAEIFNCTMEDILVFEER